MGGDEFCLFCLVCTPLGIYTIGNTTMKGLNIMNTLKSTRHAKFLINYHFIWIPKYRKNILESKDVQNTIYKEIEKLSKVHDFDVLALEIMPDHIHLFISTYPRYSPSQLMNIIKGETGKAISSKFPELKVKGSIWTKSYFVGTAGNVSSQTIESYINSQWR